MCCSLVGIIGIINLNQAIHRLTLFRSYHIGSRLSNRQFILFADFVIVHRNLFTWCCRRQFNLRSIRFRYIRIRLIVLHPYRFCEIGRRIIPRILTVSRCCYRICCCHRCRRYRRCLCSSFWSLCHSRLFFHNYVLIRFHFFR